MPEEWFAAPREAMDNPLVATVAVFACNRLMDEQRLAAFDKAAARYPYPAEIESERELLALVDGAAL